MNNEILGQVEFLLGSIGVTLSIFFSLILFFQRDKAKENIFISIYLLAFSLRIAKSLFHNHFEIPAVLRSYMLSLLFCVGPSLWLFTKHRFSVQSKFGYRDWLHYGFFFLVLSICWMIPNDGTSAWFGLFYDATIYHMFGYICFSLFWLNKLKPSYISQQIQGYIYWRSFLVANFLMVVWYYLISEEYVSYYLGISFVYSLIIVAFGAWALKLPQLFRRSSEKYLSSNLSAIKSQEAFQKLLTLMREEQPYLDPNLSLASLSKKLDLSTKELSQIINQEAQLNFAKFISQFRLEEAKRLLRSPDYAQLKIAAIAYDSGFNSISSFNAHFKKYTSITAKEYRAMEKTDDL